MTTSTKAKATGHTPGPWKVSPYHRAIIRLLKENEDLKDTLAKALALYEDLGAKWRSTKPDALLKAYRVNAQLLEALKLLRTVYLQTGDHVSGDHTGLDCASCNARDAIAAAEGEK